MIVLKFQSHSHWHHAIWGTLGPLDSAHRHLPPRAYGKVGGCFPQCQISQVPIVQGCASRKPQRPLRKACPLKPPESASWWLLAQSSAETTYGCTGQHQTLPSQRTWRLEICDTWRFGRQATWSPWWWGTQSLWLPPGIYHAVYCCTWNHSIPACNIHHKSLLPQYNCWILSSCSKWTGSSLD